MTKVQASLEAQQFGYVFEDIVITDHTVNFGGTWKNIIFIPFLRPIVYTFIFVVDLSIWMALCALTYHPTGDYYDGVFFIINTCLDVFFLARTVLAILHALFEEHRKRRIFQPEPMFLLVVDVFTMLPVAPLCFLINRYNWYDPMDTRIANYYCHAIKLPRLFHLCYMCKKVYSDFSRHPRTLIIIAHFMISTLIILCCSTLFYIHYYYTDVGTKTWADRYGMLERDNVTFKTTLLSVMYVSGFFFQDMYIKLPDYSANEEILIVATMLISYMIHIIFLTSSLLAVYVQLMRFTHLYEWRIKNVAELMRSLPFPQNLQESVNTYYRTIWVTRQGFIVPPNIVHLFPIQLKTEIYMDLYYDAIRHSKSLRNVSDGVKKEISLIFTTEIYIPGQFVFQRGKIKDKLIYLYSGIVEVLSTENKGTPVLAFSPGTILGEISVLTPYKSCSDIRCSTTCVLHVLRHKDIRVLLSRHPNYNSLLLGDIRDRLAYAQKKLQVHRKQENPISHIYWIKTRWQELIRAATTKEELEPEPLSKYYCSRYLNLLVISSQYELKVHAICIRGKCSFVMEPHSSFREFLGFSIMICEIIHFMITFHWIVFVGQISPSIYYVLPIFDLVYILDTYLQLITAVRLHNVFISVPMDIMVYKFKQFRFIIDIVAAIPYDYFAQIMGLEPYYVGMCRLPKYLRLYKVFRYFNAHQNIQYFSPKLMKFIQIVVNHTFIILACACCMYTFSCFHQECNPEGWLMKFKAQAQKDMKKPIETSDFVITLAYTTSVYLKMKTHRVIPMNIHEIVGEAVIGLLGFYLMNQTLVNMATAIALENSPRNLYMMKLSYFDNVIEEYPELKEFRSTIREYLTMQWFYAYDLNLKDVVQLMNHKSKFINYKVNHEYIIYHLKQTTLFSVCTHPFMDMLSTSVKLYLIPEGHELCSRDSRSTDLYIILDGYCEVHSFAPRDRERNEVFYLEKYDVFPIISFFHEVNSMISVKTCTAVKVLTVPYHNFGLCLKAIREDKNIFQKTIDEHLALHRHQIHRIFHWPLLRHPIPNQRDLVHTFEYKAEHTSVEKRSWGRKCWKIINPRMFTKNMKNAFSYTFDPHGNYLYYEIFWAMVVVIEITVLYLSLHGSARRSDLYYWSTYIFHALDFFDISMRCHVQYFTEQGLRVSHLRYTTMHYINRSFFVDLMCAIPFEKMRIFDIGKEVGTRMYANVLVRLLLHPLKLYRPKLLMSYLRKTIGIQYHNRILTLEYTVMFIFALCQIAAFGLLHTCTVSADWAWECPEGSWVEMLSSYHYWRARNMIYSRILGEVFSLTHFRTYPYYTTEDYRVFLIIGLAVTGVYLWYFSTMIGNSAFSSIFYNKTLELKRRYRQLASELHIPSYLQKPLLEHYTYVFKKTRSDERKISMMYDVYPNLQRNMQHAMYAPTLKMSKIFSGMPLECLRVVCQYFTEEFHVVNAIVLQCNDVNQKIYFVRKGAVELSVAGTTVAKLTPGGAYGCFSTHGSSRSHIRVVAIVNTDLLVIETPTFLETIKAYPDIMLQIRVASSSHTQFFRPKVVDFGSVGTIVPSDHIQQRPKRKWSLKTWYNYVFDDNNELIHFYNYITRIHIASLAGTLALINFVLYWSTFGEEILWICLDLFFLLDMYMSCHIGYRNLESGLTITEVNHLTKRYLKSWKFVVDVIAILPLYFFKGRMDYHNLHFHTTNKVIRIYSMVLYYEQARNTSYDSLHMRFTYLVYMMIYLVTVCVVTICVWTVIAKDIKYVPWKDLLDIFATVTIIFTSTGLESTFEDEIHGLWFTSLAVIFLNLTLVFLNIGFCRLAVSILYCDMEFRREIINFKRYCSNEYVSRPSINYCRYYLKNLFERHGGEQFSTLIYEAPNYIHEAHMAFLAESMFFDRPLFRNAHVDFHRLLMRYVQYEFFMPGATILEAGDKRKVICIVAEGRVLSIVKDESVRYYDVLLRGAAFGELQAIRNCTHEVTYKALTPVQLYILRTRDWFYMLRHFPATYKRMREELREIMKKEKILTQRGRTSVTA